MARFSLSQQIEEVERELEQREKVYPGLIAKRRLGSSIADFYVGRMHQVLRTLKWLRRNEALLRQRCPELFGEEA